MMYRMRNLWGIVPGWAAVLCMVFVPVITGCTEDAVNTTAPTEEEQTTTAPSEFAEMQAQSELIHQWIDRMDPYVSQNADGTYTLDWQAFQNELAQTDPKIALALNHGATPGKDAEVIKGLRDGIPEANKAVLEGQTEGLMQTAGYSCRTYWWGRRCCYTGYDAQNMLSIMQNGRIIWVLGWIAGFIWESYYWWADKMYNWCGGFCLNASWFGGVWVTCP